MKPVDRWLQRWRCARALAWIPWGARVLDVGCGDGFLLRRVVARGGSGCGLDPRLEVPERVLDEGLITLKRGWFPAASAEWGLFDVVTGLAVLEHVPEHELAGFVIGCRNSLRVGGKVVLTVPSPAVDSILACLRAFRLVHGMALEEHHGFEVGRTVGLFTGQGLRVVVARRFQLGFNRLFVFERGMDS